MSATGADGFGGWLLAAIGGAMNAERVGPDAAGSVRAELAKFAGAERVQAQRACRNGNRVDAKLADHAGARWAVVAGLDDQAGWRRRLAVIGCLFTGLTPALAVCEQRERGRGDRAAGNAEREWHAVHQGWAYDLAIDTGAVDPRRAAALVLAALADGKARTA